jgi:hypothetical protein
LGWNSAGVRLASSSTNCDCATCILLQILPLMRRERGSVYVKEFNVLVNEMRRNAIWRLVHVDKSPHVWDKRKG